MQNVDLDQQETLTPNTRQRRVKKTNVQKKQNQTEESQQVSIPSPKQIYSELCNSVIGQDAAKKTLSVAIYNHYKRYLMNVHGLNSKWTLPQNTGQLLQCTQNLIDKSNIILLGNTGTGKTHMIKTIARTLGVPCYIADATKITESGYVGDDVENILLGLINEADGNIHVAESGIICIDEIDKIARKSGENMSITRDVSGEGVQQSLLKIVEGSKVRVPPMGGRKHPEMQCLEIDTTNILFIGMGAFVGLDRIVENRRNRRSVGYSTSINTDNDNITNPLSEVTSDDLRQFGLIPELIGRFPVVTYTNPLTEDDLVKILTEPKTAIIKQYKQLLALDNVDLQFTDGALKEIASRAAKTKNGARSLRSVIESIMLDVMFELGGNKENITFEIDAEFVQNKFKSLTKTVA